MLSPLLLTITLDRLTVPEFDWVDYGRVDFERVPYTTYIVNILRYQFLNFIMSTITMSELQARLVYLVNNCLVFFQFLPYSVRGDKDIKLKMKIYSDKKKQQLVL